MQRLQEIAGYPLDKTQKDALDIIEQGHDLLATLPTGSGKTVIALTAIILNAFDKGHRAILTTPVKALSNQKYAEFQGWLTKIGYPNRITLLTGDIQARATPEGGDGGPELFIMTSEILANKLGRDDPDLINVSVLVMDEAHYINDTERGHVWERTVMYLPTTIQIIALSATLSEPERFQAWLSRRRPTELVRRLDRHVPLHFGAYCGNIFTELYNTKKDKVLDTSTYKKLTPEKGTFIQAINKIVKILDKEEKLPAIIFSMSKAKCEEAAYSLSQNLLYGSPPVMKKDDDPLAFGEIVSEHSWNVKTIRNRQDHMFKLHLRPYEKILRTLPDFEHYLSFLDKGIAYHHAGMIPILREYVEILFSEKLVKVVFATESLAIGINMPVKTVVFTSLEKPDGNGMVLLRPEQFMQMSGRAGRRGMDDKGYVIYYPIREMLTESEFRNLLFGKMPAVSSQLSIDPLFVLKNLGNEEIMTKSLLSHQNERYISSLKELLTKIPEVEKSVIDKMIKYTDIQQKLQSGMFKVSNAQRKAYLEEIKEMNLDEKDISTAQKRISISNEIDATSERLKAEWDHSQIWLVDNGFITSKTSTPSTTSKTSTPSTTSKTSTSEPTLSGKIASGLSDGLPLVRSSMISEISELPFEEFVGWLSCFTEPLKSRVEVPISEKLNDLFYRTDDRANGYGQTIRPDAYTTGALMYLWAKNKDISEIVNYLSSGQIGTFVKAVLRVISYIDEMKKVLLGVQYYELYNRLDHHNERLMDGIVTNRSLYVI